jgi:hypothetical protein
VSLHIGEARGYVSRVRERFDLVQVALLDSSAVAGSGAQALSESYLYTVEAFGRYLERLEPGGLLAITRWIKIPPRDNLKLAATAIEALRREGVADPGRRLVMIRGWNTATLLVRNGEFGEQDIAVVREFARRHSFDTAWYPGMPPGEANRFNRLDRPWFYEGIVALLGERAPAFIEDYKFDISPSTDQQPYFFNFFKWRALPEILSLRGRGGAGLLEWGYLVLVATLLQALLAGTVLILLPLWLSRRLQSVNRISTQAGTRDSTLAGAQGGGVGTRASAGMGTYFFLLGLAFLFIEMAFIRNSSCFCSPPRGVGRAVVPVLRRPGQRQFALARRRLAAARATFRRRSDRLQRSCCSLFTPPVQHVMGTAICPRRRVLALIAPLASAGMPPAGPAAAAAAGAVIPWAWGLNGFASVVSAALATLLAIGLGFNAVLLAALLFYGAAAVLFRR